MTQEYLEAEQAKELASSLRSPFSDSMRKSFVFEDGEAYALYTIGINPDSGLECELVRYVATFPPYQRQATGHLGILSEQDIVGGPDEAHYRLQNFTENDARLWRERLRESYLKSSY